MFIKDMLKEELRNSLQIERDYRKAVRKIPKGALVEKIIKGHSYYYLAFRENGKVKFLYKGKLDKSEIEAFRKNKECRARYQGLLADARKQIRFIRKVLRAKESV